MARSTVQRSLKALGISSPADQHRLKKDISAFWKSRLLSPTTTEVRKAAILQIAKAFIEEKGANYFSPRNRIEQQKILQSVAALIQAQRRNYLDNKSRGNKPRPAMNRTRRPQDRASNDREEAGSEVSNYVDLTEEDEDLPDSQESESDSEYLNSSWQSKRNPNPLYQTRVNTRSNRLAAEVAASQNAQPSSVRPHEAVTIELYDNTPDHEQIQAECGDGRQNSTVPNITITAESPNEIDMKPSVVEATFLHLERTWHFKAAHLKAQALHAFMVKLSEEGKKCMDSCLEAQELEGREKRKMVILLDYYACFVFPTIAETLRSCGALSSELVTSDDREEDHSQTCMIFGQEKWTFDSVDKAQALEAAMHNVAKEFKPYLQRLPGRSNDQFNYSIATTQHLQYEEWLRESLRKNGAREGQIVK